MNIDVPALQVALGLLLVVLVALLGVVVVAALSDPRLRGPRK